MRTPEPVDLTRGRLRLEPWEPRHDGELLAAAQDDSIWTWMSNPRPRDQAAVAQLRARHPGLAWAVVVDGRACGSTSYLDIDPALGGLEVGATWYARELWATDVNPTCKLLLLEHAFDALGAERVTLKTDALNTRSRAAIARLGCTYDGTLRHHRRRPDGSVRDTAYFSLLAGEWPAAREALLVRVAR